MALLAVGAFYVLKSKGRESLQMERVNTTGDEYGLELVIAPIPGVVPRRSNNLKRSDRKAGQSNPRVRQLCLWAVNIG